MLASVREAEAKAAAAAAQAAAMEAERQRLADEKAEFERQRAELADAQRKLDEERRAREEAEAAARQSQLEQQQREEQKRQAELKAQQDAFEEERLAAAAAAQAELDEQRRKLEAARQELAAIEAAKQAAVAPPAPAPEPAPAPAAQPEPAIAATDCGASLYTTEPTSLAAAMGVDSVEAELGLPANSYQIPEQLAQVIDGKIHIVLSPEHLSCALHLGAYAGRVLDEGGRVMVTDHTQFLLEVCSQLNSEDEDGSTALSRCIEDSMELAIENGAIGVTFVQPQEAE